MEQGQELYKSWLKFFEKDLDMKKDIYEMMPDTRFSGESYAEKVSDKLYYGVRDLKMDLLSSAGPFLSEDEKAYIHKWAQDAQMKIAEAGLDINKLHKAYRDTISDMRPEFVQDVNSHIFGNYLTIGEDCPISNAKTFNELLHRIHIYLERNNYLHENFPQTQNLFQGVTILGEQTPLAQQLEASLAPLYAMQNRDRAAGDISIVSVNKDSALVMIRDIGHSTSLKIDRAENGQISLSYYIPKVLNQDMAQQLPGLSSIQPIDNRDDAFATGRITTDNIHVGVDAMTLVYNIPTDAFNPNDYTATTDPSFKTAEQIIAQELPTAYFESFMAMNPDYSTSDIGIDAIMRGYERDFPGYISQCVESGYYVPESILQDAQKYEHAGMQNQYELKTTDNIIANDMEMKGIDSSEWEICR